MTFPKRKIFLKITRDHQEAGKKASDNFSGAETIISQKKLINLRKRLFQN